MVTVAVLFRRRGSCDSDLCIAATPVQQTTLNSSLIAQAKQSLEVQLAALATWETYIFGRLKTFKVPPLRHELRTATPQSTAILH